MAAPRNRLRTHTQPFTRSLLLPRAFARQFGLRDDALMRVLAASSAARDVAGVSGCAHALLAQAGLAIDPALLLRWDAAIGSHETALREARAAYAAAHGEPAAPFVLTHFQWLACAVTEWHLHALQSPASATAHVAALEALRERELPHLPPYTAEGARKLACFMATGAGKTLVLHMNLRQFIAHRLFEPDNILLLTPNEALSAQHGVELEASGLLGFGVRVTEITKFYVDNGGTRRPKKGVSEATSRYEGPNLLLVDEGHKGTSGGGGGGDDSEQGWRLKREALAQGATEACRGFTFEYSATFAQIADKSPELYDEYALCIAIDFGYARFWREGYGKQPRQLNARAESGADFALAAGLLAFYQQRRAYDEQRPLAHEHLVAPPLLACVGREVIGKVIAKDIAKDIGKDIGKDRVQGFAESDVAALVGFLARACRDTHWLATQVTAVLAHAEPAQGSMDLPALDLRWLRERMAAGGETARDVAADIARRVFGGAGEVELRLVSDKEVGLKSRGAAGDAYFGVIRVGEAGKLAEQLHHHGVALLAEPDRLAGSLFARLDADPRLAVLIGAKMFIEGWSSWRVSALGLMNVGRTPGAEIVQLFGRGVRLRGRGWSLKRDESAPLPVQVLQSLQLFGVRADYMQSYLEMLAREGVQPQVFHLPVAQTPAIATLGLQTLHVPEGRFAEPVFFGPGAAPPQHLVIEPALRASVGLGPAAALGAPLVSHDIGAGWLAAEAAFQLAQALKRSNGWPTMVLSPGAIARWLSLCKVQAPAGHFDSPATATLRKARAAAAALERGMAAAWRHAERQWRMGRLGVVDLTPSSAGLPRAVVDGADTWAWRLEVNVARGVVDALLRVAQDFVDQGLQTQAFLDELTAFMATQPGGLVDIGQRLQALLDDAERLGKEDLALPLPRLHCAPHLYAPLLLEQAARPSTLAVLPPPGEQLPLFGSEAWIDLPSVRISPPPLNRGEAKFMWDLRACWQRAQALPAWAEVHLYVLRNPAAGGLLLYRNSGFAPDFMLWLRRGTKQALALIDPKGLALQWPTEKLALIGELEQRPLSLPVRGFLVSVTALHEINALPAGLQRDVATLRNHRVLLQDDPGHVEYLLTSLLAALDAPREVHLSTETQEAR